MALARVLYRQCLGWARGLLPACAPARRALPTPSCRVALQLQRPPLTGQFLPCFLFQSPKRERIYLARFISLRQVVQKSLGWVGALPGPAACERGARGWHMSAGAAVKAAAARISLRTRYGHTFPARVYPPMSIMSNLHCLLQGQH